MTNGANYVFGSMLHGKGVDGGFVANDNGHHREAKFGNEDEHHHLHIDTLQTFLAQLHEWEQILNRSLKHVG